MMLKQKRQNEVEEAKSDKKSAMRKIRMRVKMESKKGKSAVCWIYQYSKKSLWLVILLALISGAIAGSFILLALVSSSLLDVATGVKEGRLSLIHIQMCIRDSSKCSTVDRMPRRSRRSWCCGVEITQKTFLI